MNDLPKQKLREIILQYGRSVCDEPQRCEALLRDYCGQHRKEISVLVSALKERVPTELLASQSTIPHAVLLAQLTQRLRDNLGLAEDAARWAVESWGLALGVISGAETTSNQSPPPEIPQQNVDLRRETESITPFSTSSAVPFQPKTTIESQAQLNSSILSLKEGFIGKHIRRSNRNLFVTNLSILFVLLTTAFLNGRYLYNFFLGPTQITHQTLLSINNPDILLKYYIIAGTLVVNKR
jgi:hypothetical protein